MPINTIILGASGYTGTEILRFALRHPAIEIVGLSADTHAGKNMADVFPHLYGCDLPLLQKIDELSFDNVQLVFCALPHGTTQQVIAGLRRDKPAIKIIDLSADFRLADLAQYQHWNGTPHQAPDIQPQAVYGLSEIYRQEIANSMLVANPGCYTTAAQLPLIPLLQAGMIAADDIIIDAKSGVTGAGRGAKQAMLYSEIAENFSAYGLEGHRHSAEMSEQLNHFAKTQVSFHFAPHLVPMKRGIFATIHAKLAPNQDVATLRQALRDYYASSAFVHVYDADTPAPKTGDVLGSNQCRIALYPSQIDGRVTILSVIDNLVKGASGQAIQNFNLMFGYEETLGLENLPIFP